MNDYQEKIKRIKNQLYSTTGDKISEHGMALLTYLMEKEFGSVSLAVSGIDRVGVFMDGNRRVREEFEAWIVTRKLFKKYGASLSKKPDSQYKDVRVNSHWLTWKAAREVGTENE